MALRLLSVLVVIAIFSVLNGAVYIYVLPKLFPGPSYSLLPLPLIAGVSIPALIGGYIGYRFPTAASWNKLSVGLGFAIFVGIFVFYSSMLIIVNTLGE